VTRYQQGANFERRVKKFFENLGFFVVRSAGSKSPADLVCVKHGEVALVQCKYGCGYISKKEIEKFDKLCNDLYVCGYITIVDKKGHIRFRYMNDLSDEEIKQYEARFEE